VFDYIIIYLLFVNIYECTLKHLPKESIGSVQQIIVIVFFVFLLNVIFMVLYILNVNTKFRVYIIYIVGTKYTGWIIIVSEMFE